MQDNRKAVAALQSVQKDGAPRLPPHAVEFLTLMADGSDFKTAARVSGLGLNAYDLAEHPGVRRLMKRQRETNLLAMIAPEAVKAIMKILGDDNPDTITTRAKVATEMLKEARKVDETAFREAHILDAEDNAAANRLDSLSLEDVEAFAAQRRREIEAEAKTLPASIRDGRVTVSPEFTEDQYILT